MRILLLTSETEKKLVKRELYNEDLTVESDASSTSKLGLINPNVVIFTKQFATQMGSENIIRMIQFVEIFLNSKIKYLMEKDYSEEEFIDPVYQYLLSVGNGNNFILPIQKLTLKVLRKLLAKDYIIEKQVIEDKKINYNKLNLLSNDLKKLKGEDSVEVLVNNKANIIGYLDILKSYNIQLTKTENSLEEAQEQINYFKKELDTTKQKLDNTTYKLKSLEVKHTSLIKSVLENQAKFEDFNIASRGHMYYEKSILNLDRNSTPVIYIKELEDIGFLKYFNQLVFLLQDIQEFYVKVIILEDKHRVFYDPYTKLGYDLLPKGCKLEDIINSDKIIRYGNGLDILAEVTRKEYKGDAVLIFDRTKDQELKLHSTHSNIVPFYLGVNRENYKTLDISDLAWISYKDSQWEEVKPLLEMFNEYDELNYNVEAVKSTFAKYLVNIMKQFIGG